MVEWCLVYALFGMPLSLVAIADMGRFLSTEIIFIHQLTRRCSAWLSLAIRRCFCWCRCCTTSYSRANITRPPSELMNKPFKKRKKHQGGDASPDKSGTFENISEIDSHANRSPPKQTISQETQQSPFDFGDEQNEDAEAERRVSVTFVLIILIGYTAAGACLIKLWEYWSFFGAFYYCFVCHCHYTIGK